VVGEALLLLGRAALDEIFFVAVVVPD